MKDLACIAGDGMVVFIIGNESTAEVTTKP